jgi:hypothetical protein
MGDPQSSVFPFAAQALEILFHFFCFIFFIAEASRISALAA